MAKDLLKNDKRPFTKIPNEIINTGKLSARALGVYLYMISKPTDWVYNQTDIINQFSEGREAISKAMKELKEIGLLSKIPIKNGDGRFIKWTWTIRNYSDEISQLTRKPEYGKPVNWNEDDNITDTIQLENQNTGNQSTGNPRLNNIEDTKKDITNKEINKNLQNGENEIFAFLDENLEDLRKEAKEVFDEYYEFNFRSKFIWDGKQHKNLEGLIKKLTEEAHNAGSELTNEKLINYLGTFLNRLPNLSDGFYYNNHYSPAGLNSNYQKILNHAKSRKKSKGHNYTEEGINRILEKYRQQDLDELKDYLPR